MRALVFDTSMQNEYYSISFSLNFLMPQCTLCKIKIATLPNQNRHVVKFQLLKRLD